VFQSKFRAWFRSCLDIGSIRLKLGFKIGL
jgi:hypothetical protein